MRSLYSLAIGGFVLLSQAASASNVDYFGKRYQSQPDCIQKNPVTNQCETNVDEFYFAGQDKLPFTLGSINGKTYTISDENLFNLFHNHFLPDGTQPRVENFGQFEVLLGENKSFTVRENQYYVGQRSDGKPGLGVRFIPINDENPNDSLNKQLDEFLNQQAGVSQNNKYIFNPIAYFHPEYFVSPITELSDNHRFDDGFTHMGVYIGKRRTRNAPFGYHGRKWALQQSGSYPANIYQVSYDGATQLEFNKNAYITARLLNEAGDGVQFSRLPYEQDYFDGNNLKAIFDFYRGWLDHEWVREGDSKPFYYVILDDQRYDTYCAEHITMILNIALNLVQTQKGYIDVFGRDSQARDRKGGEHFWKKAQEAWANLKVSEEVETFPVVDAAKIQPLWKYQGLGAPQAESGSSHGDPIAKGESLSYKNVTRITYPGFSLAWAPQTLPDMISDFMAYYARWDKVGPEGSKKLLMAFKEEVQRRVPQITDEQFMSSVSGIFALIDKFAPTGDYDAYRIKASEKLEELRVDKNIHVNGNGDSQFFYYSPPPVLNRIVNGLHRKNKFFHVSVLGTAVDHWEVKEVRASAQAQPVNTPASNERSSASGESQEGNGENGGRKSRNNDNN
ncbi:MAG: hypothetical protein KDD50_10045 [Bdellovibrionales bacterium]|nr:hypothetical protein [Bdellovibrionales bacterium]